MDRPGSEECAEDVERKAPLRILHVLAAARYGGLETVVLSLTRGLRERGHDVHVACLLERKGVPDESHPFMQALDQAEVPRVALRQPPRAYLKERRGLARLLEREGPDVVHTHGYRADIQVTGVARSLGLPVVSTIHGFTGGGARLGIYQWLQCRSIRQARAVVAVARPIAEQLMQSGVAPRRVHVIRNAWRRGSAPLPRLEARSLLGLPGSGFIAGWVGRLSHEKGPDIWLDAFSRLPDSQSLTCFVGSGPERPALEQRCRSGALVGRVHFVGERSDASRLLPAFDVVVLSSRTEGTPILLLEAVDAGVPVIATAVGGVPDVFSNREGWLVPPDNPTALTTAFEAVRAFPDTALARAVAAKDRMKQELSYPGWLAAYEELYRAMLRW